MLSKMQSSARSRTGNAMPSNDLSSQNRQEFLPAWMLSALGFIITEDWDNI